MAILQAAAAATPAKQEVPIVEIDANDTQDAQMAQQLDTQLLQFCEGDSERAKDIQAFFADKTPASFARWQRARSVAGAAPYA